MTTETVLLFALPIVTLCTAAFCWFLWRKDARRYRILREELTDRFILGETIHEPEDLDAIIDDALAGITRELQEESPVRIEWKVEHPPMPGWKPLFDLNAEELKDKK